MRTLPMLGLLAGLLLRPALHAQAPMAADDSPSGTFAVRCGTLLLGDGSTPLHDTWLVVVDGKIDRVGGPAPTDLPIVDAGNKVVMPGIVAVDSELAPANDSEYQVTPDAFALDAFDFEARHRHALEGGVTSAYVSPGRTRLVSGQGAVVKMAGRDLVARVLSENAALRVNFDGTALRAPRVFEPTAHPTDEDPLEPARVQLPTSRISVLAELRALFAAATDADTRPAGDGPAEHRYDERALADVVKGTLPLRAAATSAYDIRRALQLQQELGLHLVLEDPREIAPVAATAAKQNVAAVFRVPVRFGQQNPGGEDRLSDEPEPHLDAPAKAAAAGMTIGLCPDAGVPMRDYLMAVAIAVGNGLAPERALRAVGVDAAKILGVDQRVGSLQKGKDADFVILSGDPLAVGTMVESTWIDGERAFSRKSDSQVLAVRVGRILDGEGGVYRDGVVIVQNGRIKAVGEDLAIPYGAEVLDCKDGVATPGFVDAFSHLGLSGEGTGVPGGAPNQRLQDVVQHDDPAFAAAIGAGVTTVLSGGKDGGLVSGRLAAFKTGAGDQGSVVLRDIVGQRFVFDAIGPDAVKPLADQLGRARQYVAAWEKYEKELAEWQTGKAAAPAPAPAPAAAPAEGEAKPEIDPITGVWEADIDIQGRMQLHVTLDLKRDGNKVTGTIGLSFAGREIPPQPIAAGSFEGGKLRLEFRGMGGEAVLEATVQGDSMNGTLKLGPMGEQPVSGTRTSKTAGAGATSAPKKRVEKPKGEEGKPKAPKLDEALEPMRAVLGGKATMVVKTDRASAIQAVVELLEKEKVSYALASAEDLLDDASLLGSARPPVVIGPEVVVEDDGALVNVASRFADLGMPLLLGSDDTTGTRYLPLHAAYAVRYGLSPQDALQALTLWPAKVFHLDDRIGSLQKGKDADLVVFSGDPFEPTSRVLMVICNGHVVVDRREQKQ